MGSAMAIGLGLGGLTAATSFASAEKSRSDQLARASQAKAQAAAIRAQAASDKRAGELEAYGIDRQKSRIRREFQEVMGKNRASLGAGNVDLSSGSALDVAYGNIDNFASDMGDNAYRRALKLWETEARDQTARYQADVQDASATYLQRTAGSIGTSILTGLLSGAGGFASGYSLAGGSLKNLFSFGSGGGIETIAPGSAGWGGAAAVKGGYSAKSLAAGILRSAR